MKWFSGLEGRYTLCRGRKAPVLWPPLFALGSAGRHTIKKYPETVTALGGSFLSSSLLLCSFAQRKQHSNERVVRLFFLW
jgi:hypothetical protein